MKQQTRFLPLALLSLALASCSAIPTLPPPDSTVTIRTPRFTLQPTAGTQDPLTPTSSTTAVVETLLATQASQTASPTATDPGTDLPTETPEPTLTATPTLPPTGTATDTPAPTATASFTPTATQLPYRVQIMNPLYLENFVHQDLGCDWLGVAGQVFDAQGAVVKNIVIKAGGEVAGRPVLEDMAMPLTDPAVDLAYGPGGYELVLSLGPASTEDQVWVQLHDLQGVPLSEKIYLTTYDDCQKNLLLLNFNEQ